MSWQEFIKSEYKKDYFQSLKKFVKRDAEKFKIYPHRSDLFNAFNLCLLEKTKVVIIGQDPYHGPNQAHGLAFSVLPGQPIPPSLRNIFIEIDNNFNQSLNIKRENGCLIKWAEQGVLLLNSILTVRDGQPGSHKNQGWEIFTDNAIKHLEATIDSPIIYMLWGAYARSKKNLISNYKNRLILESGHPSPLSSKLFFGNKHFLKANNFLQQFNIQPINWL